jgi:chloride channel, nucleotide-sensitive, 1A
VHLGKVIEEASESRFCLHYHFCSRFSALLWKFNDRDDGISIPWTKIGVHAISSGNGASPSSVYFIIDINLNWPGVYEFRQQNNQNGVILNHDGGDDEEDENDEGHETDGSDDEMTEFWLIPSDQTLVTPIYNAMKDCQVLHPDPADSVDDSEEDGKKGTTYWFDYFFSTYTEFADDFMEAEDNENEEDEGQGQGGPDLRNLNLNDGDNDDNKYADAD